MKGNIIRGGTGSRLHPFTKLTNSHVLPVVGKPVTCKITNEPAFKSEFNG